VPRGVLLDTAVAVPYELGQPGRAEYEVTVLQLAGVRLLELFVQQEENSLREFTKLLVTLPDCSETVFGAPAVGSSVIDQLNIALKTKLSARVAFGNDGSAKLSLSNADRTITVQATLALPSEEMDLLSFSSNLSSSVGRLLRLEIVRSQLSKVQEWRDEINGKGSPAELERAARFRVQSFIDNSGDKLLKALTRRSLPAQEDKNLLNLMNQFMDENRKIPPDVNSSLQL